MEPLRLHFRPEFINRLDEIIVFHALDREQIRQIVELNLERVRRTARGQGVELEIDGSLVEHLAEAGYRPEFGARELRRLIRATLETELARAMLGGEVHDGDRVLARWDAAAQQLILEPHRDAPAAKPTRRRGEARKPNGAGAEAGSMPPPSEPSAQPQAGA